MRACADASWCAVDALVIFDKCAPWAFLLLQRLSVGIEILKIHKAKYGENRSEIQWSGFGTIPNYLKVVVGGETKDKANAKQSRNK